MKDGKAYLVDPAAAVEKDHSPIGWITTIDEADLPKLPITTST